MRGVLNFPSVTGHRSTSGATTTAGSSIRGGVCRQERVGQGWMDIEACIEEGERGRDAKEELQTLALDLFQTAYRAFRPHIRHDLLYSPAPPYVEATVRSFLDQIRLVDYRCARVYLVESFHGSRGQSSRDDQSDQSN